MQMAATGRFRAGTMTETKAGARDEGRLTLGQFNHVMPRFLSAPLRGIVPPLVTPLLPDGSLDADAVPRLVEHVVGGGVAGVFILGTTGEGPCHPRRVQEAMIASTVRAVAGRIPVLVGITACAVDDSVGLARFSAGSGADAVVLAPPFYLPATGDDMRRHVERVLAGVSLPLFLYNMPSLVKTPISLDLLRWAVDQPGIVGFKDSGGDFGYFHKALQATRGRAGFTVFIGPEELVGDAVLFGAHGGVSGGAQVFPRLYVALCEAAAAGNLTRVRRLNDVVQRVSREVYGTTGYAASVIRGIKGCLRARGVCDDIMSEPFGAGTEAERARLKDVVAGVDAAIEAAMAPLC